MNKYSTLTNSIKWWEKQRLWYNLIIGATGIITLLIVATYFNIEEFIGLLVYGAIANLFFSLGLLLEIFDFYYFNNSLKIKNFRYLFLISGVIISCLITLAAVHLHYMPMF